MHGLFGTSYFHLFDLGQSINLCLSALHHIAFFQEEHDTSTSLQVISKTSYYFTDITFFIFIAPKQQDHLSQFSISILIDKDPINRYRAVLNAQRINWDSFEFKVEALNEAKINIIDLFSIQISMFLHQIFQR